MFFLCTIVCVKLCQSGHMVVKKKGVKLASEEVQGKTQVSDSHLKMKVNVCKWRESKRERGEGLGW